MHSSSACSLLDLLAFACDVKAVSSDARAKKLIIKRVFAASHFYMENWLMKKLFKKVYQCSSKDYIYQYEWRNNARNIPQ